MDEADVLGDRVAVMSRGRLRAYGSPLWLKAKFGAGYRLTITTKHPIAEAAAPKGSRKQAGSLSALVERFVPNATVGSLVAREATFRLPLGASRSFPGLLKALDESGAPPHEVTLFTES